MFLIMSPEIRLILIYLLAAIVPAVILMYYIYQQDKVEKEPGKLLWQLVLRGIYAALAAMVLEYLYDGLLDYFVTFQSHETAAIIEALGVGIIEEGCKFFFLYRKTWKDPNFNFRYDGIVYAVFVSLGFAAFENVLYVFRYGLGVAGSRALLAVPAHMGFAVVMGAFYGRGKVCECYEDYSGKTLNLLAGYLLAVLLHAFYDGSVMIGTTASTVAFIVFVIVMYLVIFKLIKHESNTDRPVD